MVGTAKTRARPNTVNRLEAFIAVSSSPSQRSRQFGMNLVPNDGNTLTPEVGLGYADLNVGRGKKRAGRVICRKFTSTDSGRRG